MSVSYTHLVNLVISKGPKPSEKVEVPQLLGLTKDQAEAALARQVHGWSR